MPNFNNSPQQKRAILPLIFIIVAGVALVCTIIFLKRGSDRPLMPDGTFSDSLNRTAIPDTTTDNSAAENSGTAPMDSMTMDLRVPSDAGYEDGYWAGYDDGASEHGDNGTSYYKASYDDTSKFPNAAQRLNYKNQYVKGYEEGFKAGRAGKPFEIPDN